MTIFSNNYEQILYETTINTINAAHFVNKFPKHWHKNVEIVSFQESDQFTKPAILIVNQITYQLVPGDILYIWPGELHEIIQNPDKKIIAMQFSPTIFNELPDFAPYLHLFRTFHLVKGSESPALSQSAIFRMEQMIEIRQSERPFCGVEALINLYEMFMEFCIYINENLSDEHSLINTNKTLEKINQACHFIQENCEHSLTLDRVSEYIGFSSCYFSRCFKKTTNYSFVEYLTRQRIKHAQVLLIDSNISVTEVAYQSGFRSLSTFNRVFRQYSGCSPVQYKRYYVNELL